MNDFIETRSGVYIRRSDIMRLEQADDDPKLWIATSGQGKYFILKSKLPMTAPKKVTK